MTRTLATRFLRSTFGFGHSSFPGPLDAMSGVMRLWPRLARDPVRAVASGLFATAAQTPAVQSLQQRLEKGGVVSCAGVCPSAQPFLSALLRYLFPHRPVVIVTAGLKTQESFHQDIATWMQIAGCLPAPRNEVARQAGGWQVGESS